MNHYYAFVLRDDSPIPFYERTFSTLDGVLRWVEKQKRRAFFTINCLPKRYWY